MSFNLKVTLLIALLSIILIDSNQCHAQGIVPVKDGNTWSYQRESTGESVYTNLDGAEPFRNGVGIAKKNGKWGALDLNMKEIIPFDYELLDMLFPNVFRAYGDREFVLYNEKGLVIKSGLKSAVDSEVIPESIIVSNAQEN